MIVKMYLAHEQLAALHVALDSDANLVEPDGPREKYPNKHRQFASIIKTKGAGDSSLPVTHYNVDLEIQFLKKIKGPGDREKYIPTPRRVLDAIWDAIGMFPVEDET